MPGGRKQRPASAATRWVHAFEDDTDAGAVYRPDSADLPLTRRPRERLELRADGTARVQVPGPDDRLVVQEATWTREGNDVVVRTLGSGSRSLRIVSQTADRLVIRR